MKNLTPLHLPEVDNIPSSPQLGFYKIYLRNGVAYKLDGNGVETPFGSFNESDPIFVASAAYDITTQNIANWNTAYSWGNHAVQGYLTQAVANTLYAGINHTHTFAQITSKPTTLTGYGITDPVVLTSIPYSDPSWITALSWNKIVGAPSFVTALAALTDVQLTTLSEDQLLRYSNGFWRNWSPNFLTQAIANGLYVPLSAVGAPNGVASLNGSGQVPAAQLPSYVDDVLEYATLASFPTTGETGKIYVALDTNETYRWSGTTYVRIANGAVQSVNLQTGNVVLTTDNVSEGTTNKYYTDARVKTYADTLYVALAGSYSNPSWITSLAWSKITGAPSFLLGTGTTNYVTKWSGTSLVDSIIYENGGVGIGTNNPTTNAMLHVVGGLPTRTKSLLLDSTWDYQTSFSMRNGIYSTEFNLGGASKSSNEGGPGSLQVSTYNATSGTYRYPVTFYANGNVSFAGNLGSVPADNGSTLQVNGTIQQSSVTGALLKASATGVLVAAVPGVDYLVSVATPTLDTVTTAGNVTTNAITVGNVTVNGNAGTGFFHNALANYDGLSGLQLNRADGTERAFFKLNPFSGEVRIGAAGTGYYTTFYTASVERMRIFAASGNVAINTATDSGFKLDVNGTARVSELTIKGSSIALISGLVNTTPVGDFSMNTSFYQFRTYAAGTSFLWKVSDGSNKMDLTQAGVLRLYALAGTGTRMVVADEFGQLSVQAVPSYSETDTLDSVTDRGAITTNAISVGGLTTTGITVTSNGNLTTTNQFYGIVTNYTDGIFVGYDSSAVFLGYKLGSTPIHVGTQGTGNVLIRTSGNTIIENGRLLIGTSTDAGYRADIVGSLRISDTFTLINPAAPSYNLTISNVASGRHKIIGAYGLEYIEFGEFGNSLSLGANVIYFNTGGNVFAGNATISSRGVEGLKFNATNFYQQGDTRTGFQFIGDYTAAVAGGTSTLDLVKFNTNIATAQGTINGSIITLTPTINTVGGTTNWNAIYYNPTVTGTTGLNHFFINATIGKVKLGDLSGTGSRMVVADANGVLSTQAIPAASTTPTLDQVTTAGNITTNTITVGGITSNGAISFNTPSAVTYGLYWTPAQDSTQIKIFGSNYSVVGYNTLNVMSGTDGLVVNGNERKLTINAAGSSVYLDTVNMIFTSHGTGEAMRIVSSSKNVLIGTTTDNGYTLNVNGTFRVTSQADFVGLANPGHSMARINDNGTLLRNDSFVIDNATGNAGQLANLSVGATHGTAARLFVKGSGATSATTAFLVQNSAGVRMLNVADDSTLTIGTNSNNTGALLFQWSRAGINGIFYGDSYSAIYGSITLDRGTGEMRMFTGSTYFPTFYSSGSEAMRISTSRNVLIGTTTDAGYKVDINGTLRASGRILQGFGGFVNNCLYTYISNHCGSAGLIGFGFTNTDNPVAGDSVFDIYQGVAIAPDAALFNFKHNILNSINSVDQSFIAVTGTINRSASVSGIVRGIYYNPTTTAVNGTHYAWESTSGKFKISDLSGTGTRMVVADANGVLGTQAIPTGGGGSGTVTSVGLTIGTSGTDINVSNSPITSAGDIVLNIPNASETARGVVSTANQTFVGKKTFKATSLVIDTTATSSLLEGKVNGIDHGYIYFGPYFQFTATASATSGFLWKIGDGTNAMELAQTGKLRFNKYGINTFAGTATKGLGVDADGYVVEYTIPASGGSISLTTTGSSGAATLVGTTLNIPTYTLEGLGGITLTSLSSTATGLTYTNTTGVFSLTSGYAIPTTDSATNWDTAYTNRITSLTTTGSSGAATLISNTLNIPTYTLAGLGGVPTSRTLTINGVTFDLTADRSWTVTSATPTLAEVTTAGNTTTNAITVGGLTVNTNDATIRTLRIGLGAGSVATNMAIGVTALNSNSTGTENTAIGYEALYLSTGIQSTVVGYRAGKSIVSQSITAIGHTSFTLATGTGNTGLGRYSGSQTTTGAYNTAVGESALSLNTTGVANTAVGYNSVGYFGAGTHSKSENVGVGYFALAELISGNNNVAVGVQALWSLSAGSSNTAIGWRALAAAAQSNNTAVGFESLRNNSTASGNVAVGYRAGYTNSTGTNITAIGYEALYSSTGSESTVVGYQAGRTIVGNTITAIGYQAGYQTTGTENTVIGNGALINNTSGAYNTMIGHRVAFGWFGNINPTYTGTGNTSVGHGSMYYLQNGSQNVALGISALFGLRDGSNNVAIGSSALSSNNASGNVAVGWRAAFTNTTASEFVAIGYEALYTASTGIDASVAIGYQAARNATAAVTAIGRSALLSNTGARNTAVGIFSMSANTSGMENTAMGHTSMNLNKTGSYNTAYGYRSLMGSWTGNASPVYSGSQNVAIGYDAMAFAETASENTAVGTQALWGTQSGNFNVAVGLYALGNNNGNNNTAIGYKAGGFGVINTTGANNIFIGYQATGVSATESNRTWIGNSATTSTWLAGNVLIGTTTNSDYKLDVNGSFRNNGLVVLTTLSAVTTTQILYYDAATGVVTYGAAPGGGGGYVTTAVTTSYVESATSGTKFVVVDTTGGAVTVTLPSAVGNTATLIFKKTAGTASLILDGQGSETIDGGTTATLVEINESVTLLSNNSNWLIV